MCPFCQSRKVKTIICKETWSIVACRKCKNAWTIASPQHIKREKNYFGDIYAYENLEELPYVWRKCLHMQADLLENYLPYGASILDIGCGQGFLLELLKNRAFNAIGMDPNKKATEKAIARGLNVISGCFPNRNPSQQFDGVVVSHVLEHVRDPIEFLSYIPQTAPEGIILFVQTNWRGLMPRIHKENWYAWEPSHHLWHFTPYGLSLIIRKMGWEVIELQYSSLIHKDRFLSRIWFLFDFLGDQFHLIAKI